MAPPRPLLVGTGTVLVLAAGFASAMNARSDADWKRFAQPSATVPEEVETHAVETSLSVTKLASVTRTFGLRPVFSGDGQRLMVSDADGSFQVWAAASGEMLGGADARSLEVPEWAGEDLLVPVLATDGEHLLGITRRDGALRLYGADGEELGALLELAAACGVAAAPAMQPVALYLGPVDAAVAFAPGEPGATPERICRIPRLRLTR